MVFTAQQNFTGAINGQTVTDLNNKIDYKKNKLADRMAIVESIVNEDFYEEYFEDYFSPCINSTDSLSSDNNVCKSLERMANYILNSQEVKQMEDEEKTKYVFHTNRKYFEKKLAREQSISQTNGIDTADHENNIVHIFKTEESNFRLDRKQKITAKDLERTDKLGEVLQSYNTLLQLVNSELSKKSGSKYNRYLLTKTKSGVVDDMIISKDSLLGVWGYHLKNVGESTKPEYNIFDFTNEYHLKGGMLPYTDKNGNEQEIPVKGLIYFNPVFVPNNDFAMTLYDLDRTIEKAGLNEKEKATLKGIREGQPKNEIAEELGFTNAMVTYYIDEIVKKIIKVGNKYDKDELFQ